MKVAVLISGGLDSAILLGLMGQVVEGQQTVYPLYVRCGLFYEKVELACLRRFLNSTRHAWRRWGLACPNLQPLQVLEMPVADLYGAHWSITGRDVPVAGTPDEAVFLPGRNVLLLAKALVWCHLHGVARVALGSLQSNPFPDATPAFFSDYQNVVNRAIGGSVEIRLPFAGLHKADVMHLGRALPLEHTFSCINPRAGLHCGTCNKCDERRQAFAAVAMTDPTTYFKNV